MKFLVAALAFVLTFAPATAQNGLPGGPGQQIPNSTGGGSGGGGSPTGAAGGGLTGTYPNPTVATNANLTGDVTSVGNATTLTNAPVIAKVLTGFTSGAGTVSASDSILSALQKINGNVATRLPLAGGTMSGNIAMGGNAITGGGAITGTTITGTTYAGLPVATTSVSGVVKPDGTTITAAAGVLTSIATVTVPSTAWTPTITAATTAGVPTYGTQTGSYMQVGNLVVASFQIALSAWTGSPVGFVSINNLPVISGSSPNAQGTCFITYYSTGSSTVFGVNALVTTSRNAAFYASQNTASTLLTAALAGTTFAAYGTCVYHS